MCKSADALGWMEISSCLHLLPPSSRLTEVLLCFVEKTIR